MNREDIIRMAREATKEAPREDWNSTAWVFGDETLERFAALVAKHTLANIDPSSFMSWQEGYSQGRLDESLEFEREAREAVEFEREACAKVCDGYSDGRHANMADLCAEAIRARGQE